MAARKTAATRVDLETKVSYLECMRNHSPSLGWYTYDGCISFEPSSIQGTEGSKFCAICGCHRNFHRIVEEILPQTPDLATDFPLHPTAFASRPPRVPPITYNFMNIEEERTETKEESAGEKKARIQFTEAQKDEMMSFADKLGWGVRGNDKKEIQQFCSQIGVPFRTFQSWMHNQKRQRKSMEGAGGASASI